MHRCSSPGGRCCGPPGPPPWATLPGCGAPVRRRAPAHRDGRHGGRVLPPGPRARPGVAGAARPDDAARVQHHQRVAGERHAADHRCGRGRGQPARRRRGPDRGQLVTARAGRGLQRRPADRRPATHRSAPWRTCAGPRCPWAPRTRAWPTWRSGCSRRRGLAGPDDVTPPGSTSGARWPPCSAGDVDAFFWVGALPTTTVTDLAAAVPLRLLDLEPVLDGLRARYPVYVPGTVLAGTYRIADPVATLLVRNVLLVDADLDAGLVEALTAALFAEQQRLADATQAARTVDAARRSSPSRCRCTTARCAGSPTTRWPDRGMSRGPTRAARSRRVPRPHPPGPGSATGAALHCVDLPRTSRSIAASKNAAPCSLNGCRWPTSRASRARASAPAAR